MKISLQKLFLLFASTSFGICIAQPTLTDANCNPVAGENFTVIITPTIAPGSAGANQNWNLSAMSFSATGNVTISTTASTPSSSPFPSSNVSYRDGILHQFFRTSPGGLQYYGDFYYSGSFTGTTIVSYTDPVDYLHLPLNFNDTYIDGFQGTKVLTSGIAPTQIRNGTATVTADGYGTLTVPTGSFANVMRVHMQSAIRDSIANSSLVAVLTQDEYLWYRPGTHYPIAGIIYYDGDMRGFYISSYPTGLKENNVGSVAFELYPSPASDHVNIHFPISSTDKTQVSIYNSLGQELKTFAPETMSDDVKINVSDLPNGIYILQLSSNNNRLTGKRFIINR